jgi:hypothetical protein
VAEHVERERSFVIAECPLLLSLEITTGHAAGHNGSENAGKAWLGAAPGHSRRRSPPGRLALLLNSYLRVVFGIEVEDDRTAGEAG